MKGISIKRSFSVRGSRCDRTHVRAELEPTVKSATRLSRLLALTIHFDRLLREGVVANQTELAM